MPVKYSHQRGEGKIINNVNYYVQDAGVNITDPRRQSVIARLSIR